MKVVILCGGRGTRLREKTEIKPKPMIEIGGKPILWHIMKIYSYFGFNEFVLCLGYKGDIIKRYFYHYELLNNDFTVELGQPDKMEIHSSHNETDWKVTLADTGIKTLKGGRIKRIEKYIDEDTFMLTYGDGLADINLKALLSFHKKHGRLGTITGVHPPSRFGEMDLKDQNVVSFTEKPQASRGRINGGFFVLNNEIFDYLTSDEDCNFEIGPLEKIAKNGELMIYKNKGQWMCMDTYRDMQYLNKLYDEDKAFWKVWSGNFYQE